MLSDLQMAETITGIQVQTNLMIKKVITQISALSRARHNMLQHRCEALLKTLDGQYIREHE